LLESGRICFWQIAVPEEGVGMLTLLSTGVELFEACEGFDSNYEPLEKIGEAFSAKARFCIRTLRPSSLKHLRRS
jgi:hypothetical protein